MLPVALLTGTYSLSFRIVFGVFVVALVALVVITLRWAVRRDRQGRIEWERRHQTEDAGPGPRRFGPRRPPTPSEGRGATERAADSDGTP